MPQNILQHEYQQEIKQLPTTCEKKWNPNEGTITFWTNKNSIDWKDNKENKLVTISSGSGGIYLNKSEDNKLKLIYIVTNKGKAELDEDVSELDKNKAHFIAITWDLINNKEVKLYIDGEEKEKKKIEVINKT